MDELIVKYFDTIPPCTSICVLKTGFLFAASEFGNHALYQFQVSASQHGRELAVLPKGLILKWLQSRLAPFTNDLSRVNSKS